MSAISSTHFPCHWMPLQQSEKANRMYQFKELKPFHLNNMMAAMLLSFKKVNSWILREENSNIYCLFKEEEGLSNIREFNLNVGKIWL